MKLAGLFLLLFPPFFTCISQYNVREIRYGDEKTPEFKFPVFLNSKSLAADKINRFLQADFFETTTAETSETGLFDKSRYILNDSVTQSGYTSISYGIELNNPQILSLMFEVEGMGAYPTYFKRYFVFHSDSGQPLTVDTLFTPGGIAKIKITLMERREKIIRQWIGELKRENESIFREDSAFVADTFKECNASAHEQNVFMGKDKLLFYKEDCFPHAWGPYEAGLDIVFTYKEAENYLSAFARRLLFVSQQ